MKTNKYILTLALTICCALGNLYAINSTYYSSIDGKKDSGLREALTTLLYNNHTTGLSYDWDFDGIDWDSNGNVYDIYSDCGHKKTDGTGSYKCCCDAINREHVVPQSIFDSKPPQYADRHHLYVVDGKANGYRSNYAFGECSGGTKGSCSSSSTVKPSEGTATCSNHEYGKLGTSTFTEVKISDKVYEPADEYKGDIARAIMYMVVRYATADYCKVKSGSGTSANAYPVTAWSASSNCGLMFSSSLSTNYGLSNYGKALLLKWHRNDPVSAREIARNEGVAAKQGNRNPFIDYPCLAEYLWGNKAGETVTLSSLVGTFTGSWTTGDGCPCGDDPAITLPTGAIDCGSTSANTPITKTITVQGVNLTGNLTLGVSGGNSSLFSLNATTILKAAAEAGTTVTITYTPTSAGSHSAVLTISGGGLASSQTFALSGTCCNPYTVTFSRNGITEQVGACGTYTLPTADDEEDACDGWEFQGWVTSSTPFSEGQTSAPTFVTEVNSATTLYAVYGKAEASSAPRRATMADTWTRVTSMTTLTDGGTFIMGYEATAKSGTIIPLRSKDCNATTSGNGYFNTGTTASSSTSGTLDMTGTITSTDYEVYISSPASGKINIQMVNSSGNYYGATSGGTTSNKGKLYTSGNSNETNLTVEWDNESNNTFKLTAGVTGSYKYLKYNTSSPRFAFYNSAGGQVVFYKKSSGGSSTTTYKKLPCTTYTISYVDEDGIATGGSYEASAMTALAGTTITLDYDEAVGYEFAGWTVTNASTSATIAVTNGQFTMPEANVTVQANFNALCSKLSAPDVTATPGDGQITLTWEDVTDAVGYTVSIGTGAGYTTECGGEATGMNTITHSGTTNTCEITGLTNGLAYTTYVVAKGISSVCDSDADEDTTTPSAEIPTEVTVTFNANGGEGTMSDQTIPYNTATALDANAFTRTGYTFQGWATEQSGAKEYNDGASVTLTEDITLYAVWQINSHNVTFTQPTTGGTFTVNSSSSSPVSNVNYGSTVTIAITPTNSHFTVNTVTVTGASGAVAVLGEGNTRTFTMPDEDVTVSVTLTEDTKYTVNWYVNGTATPETNYAGEALAGIANPSIDCNDKVFQGWTSHNDYDSDQKPDDLFTDASTKTMPSNNNTSYYAVFATVEEETTPGTASWTETAITALTSTDVFVIVGNNGSNYAMTNNNGTTSAPTATDVTIADGEISGTPADDLKWNISGNGTDGYTFYPNGLTTTWLYCTNTNNGVRVGTNDNKTFTIDGGYLKHTGTNRYVGVYNSTDWRCYTSITGTSNIKDQTFAFYKYTEGSGSTTTTITGYTTSCVAPEYYDVNFTPTMTGATITVNGQSTSPQSVESGATVSIAINPDAAHTVSGVSVTGGVTPSGSGNDWSFTMPAGDVTVTVTLADVPAHTVTWSANGVTTTEQYYEGQAIAFPGTATGCDGKEFTGWSAETVAETDIAPSYVTEATMGTSDLTYYAVFAQCEPDKWDRITTADDFISGNYLIVSEEAGDALKNATLSRDYWFDVVSVDISNHSITTSDANIIWNVAKSSSNYTFYNETVSKYLAIVTSGSYKNLNLSDSPCDFTASFSDNAVILSANSRQITRHASYAEYLAGESQTDNKIYLYKQRISGYTTSCEACENKVTITKGTAANGSFSLNKTGELSNCSSGGIVVTVSDITPAAGYEFGAITQTGIASGVTIDQSAKTVTYAQNVTGTSTINVVFVALPTYTIRFIDNGAVISTQEVFDGQAADAPSDPTPCDEKYTFEGWANATLAEDSETKPTLISDFTASADQDYYAVYSETSGGGASTPVTRTMSTFTAVSGNVDSDENISYAAAQGASATAPAVNTGEIRIYQNGGTLTVTANNSKKITAVTIGSSMATSVTYAIDGGSASANQSIAAGGTLPLSGLNASSILFTCTGTSRTTRLYLNYLSVTYSDGGSGSSTTYYTTAPNCEPAVTPADMMIVAEYGGARIALTHNNDYTTFGALPMMFVGGKYFYPNTEAAPVVPNMTWQVTEMDGEGYTIKAGEQYLAPNNGAITLSDKSYPWPIDEDGAISYDAVHQTFVVGGEGSLLPKIHVVPVPKADDIQLTSLHSDRTLTPKRFGTLCLPHAVALPFAWGVRVYSVAGAARDDSGNLKGIYLEEEIEMLEAGKPYLIEPVDEKNTSTMQMWYAEGMDYVTEPVDAIAMVGNLSETAMTVPRGYYVLNQNQLRKVAIDNQTIGQYKAYFDLNDLEDPVASPQAHAYRVMYVADSEQVVTDLSQTPGGINWNEPVYNILGMRVDRNATGVLIQGGVKFIIRVP